MRVLVGNDRERDNEADMGVAMKRWRCRYCDYGRLVEKGTECYCNNEESDFYEKYICPDFVCNKFKED